jgi:glutamine amidotransferase
VAAVRRASPGLALVESGNAPFVAGRWAFSLNGFVGGFAEGTSRPALVGALSATRAGSLAGDTDTEVLLGLVLDHLDDGVEPGAALAAVVGLALDAAGDRDSRINLLLSDGSATWATRWSNSLFHRTAAGGVVVASEPWDDGEGWTEAPDRSVVHATPEEVVVSPLA